MRLALHNILARGDFFQGDILPKSKCLGYNWNSQPVCLTRISKSGVMKTYLKDNKETICISSILDACPMKDSDSCSKPSYSYLIYQMIYQTNVV